MNPITLYLNCDSHPSEPTWNKADYLLRAGVRAGKDVRMFVGSAEQPDYILNIEPYSRVIIGKQWTGVYEIDLLCDRPQCNDSNWAVANTVYIAVSSLPARLEQVRHKTTLLFQACDPVVHQRDPSVKQEYDFVIAGSLGIEWYKEREEVIIYLRDRFKYKNFGKGVSPQEYIRRLSSARVQLIRSMNTPVANGELAQRFFECLALGPVLTNYVDDLKLTGLVENEDYMAYRSREEAAEKMKLLVTQPELAQKIAESGRKKALRLHTYEKRLETIFADISSLQQKKSVL